MARLILLDRDGVLNVDSPDYVKTASEWHPIPGALDAVAALKRADFLVAVCSNQSAVGRGIMSETDLQNVHTRMEQELAARGARLDAVRYCRHAPEDECGCRKPRPGMLIDVMQTLGVTGADTIFVGDAIRDIEAAHAAGCRSALVRSGHGAAVETIARGMGVSWVGDDLAAFCAWALEQSRW